MGLSRVLPWAAAVAVAGAASLTAAPAEAWQESHEAYAEVHATVDPNGTAHFEQSIAYRVVRGPLRSFDIDGVEKNAVPEQDAVITAPDGRELAAHVEMHGERTLRVTVGEPRQLMRGTFVFHVKYAVDLVAARELVRDGAMWRLSWTAPTAAEGFDGGKVVFALPPAPTEPRAVDPETGDADERILATLKRTTEHDELELVRPHVARGEAPVLAIRLDPKAFPEVQAPQLRPTPAPPPPPPSRARDALMALAVAAIGALFALLVWHKDRAFARAAGAMPENGHGFVPLSRGRRAALAGMALAAALAVERLGRPTIGACLVGIAMLLAATRAPQARAPARGPGRWLALRPEEAFARGRARAGGPYDPATWTGRLAALLALALIAGAAIAARALDTEAPYLVAIDGMALLPIFVTGRATQLAPDLAKAPARGLARIFRALRRRARRGDPLRIVPWARIPAGTSDPDELRLLVVPRVAMPGVLGIEVGFAYGRTPTGWAAAPEVLVRVQEQSPAAQRLSVLAREARTVPGRRPDERVLRFVARTATARATTDVTLRLARELVDRRKRVAGAPPWSGAERRRPFAHERAAA